MALLVKCLWHKREDLSLIHRTHMKKIPRCDSTLIIPVLPRQRQEDLACWPASLAASVSSRPGRDLVSKNKAQSPEEQHPWLTSGP